MPATVERVDVFHRHVQLFRNEGAHARGIEHAGHADDALARELRQLVDRLRHGVERIGHRDDDAVRRVLDHLLGDLLHDLVVHVEQIVAAHARLARQSRGDHDDVRPGALGVVAGTEHPRVGPVNRTGLEHVERHPGGLLIGNIDNDDVGELLVRDAAGYGGTDVPRSPDHGYFAIHVRSLKLSTTEVTEDAEVSRRISCPRPSCPLWWRVSTCS
jgi:hypothetical protein